VKFADIVKGSSAHRVIDFPLMGIPGERSTVQVKVRALPGDDCAEVLRLTRERTKTEGGKPEAGDPLYELYLRVFTIWLGCIDPDHAEPDSEGARFFAGPDEILSSDAIGRDGIWFLYECQESWQDYVSPNLTEMGEQEFFRRVIEVADSNDPLVCAGWRPAIQWSFMRSMARQLLTVLQHKSLSGQSSTDETQSEPKKPAN
jgi:hypothetical protein